MTAFLAEILDIDSAIERWQAAGNRLAAARLFGAPQRCEATSAFNCVDTALKAERGYPLDLEDFSYPPRFTRSGGTRGYEIALHGVPLGSIVCEEAGYAGWAYYPTAAVALSNDERVPLGEPARAHPDARSSPREPQQIGEALNDAAIVCLLRLRQPTR